MDMQSRSGSERQETAPNLGEIKVIHSSAPSLEKTMSGSRQKDPLMKRFMRWLVPDQRVANRHTMPPVVAYLGLAQTSKEYKIGDISVAGFYMITEERWIAGTGFPITLERTDVAALGQKLTVYCTAVRTGVDGVGFTFLKPETEDQHGAESHSTSRVDLTKLAQFLKGLPLSDPHSEELDRAS